MHLDEWSSFFSLTHQLFQAGIYLKSEFLKQNFNSLVIIRPRNQWCTLSHLVMSDSLGPQGQKIVRLLCPWNFPGKNTGVGCRKSPPQEGQGIFLILGLNPSLLHWPVDSWLLSHLQALLLHIFIFGHMVCETLAPWPGTEPIHVPCSRSTES